MIHSYEICVIISSFFLKIVREYVHENTTSACYDDYRNPQNFVLIAVEWIFLTGIEVGPFFVDISQFAGKMGVVNKAFDVTQLYSAQFVSQHVQTDCKAYSWLSSKGCSIYNVGYLLYILSKTDMSRMWATKTEGWLWNIYFASKDSFIHAYHACNLSLCIIGDIED